MEYDAITIDTQVVYTNGYAFDNGLLAQLKQFGRGPTRVVISQVIASEILKELKEKIEETISSIHSTHRDAIRYGIRDKDEVAFENEPEVAAIARKRLGQYFREIGVEIIPYDNVQMKEVLDLYFRSMPPFARRGKKKAEFPDAVALLSLESWANENKVRLLAVSGDADWVLYAARSKNITVVEPWNQGI